MSNYHIDFTDKAKKHIEKFNKAGKISVLKKINILLSELEEHPRTGTGHPERLKGYPNAERWSRRITDEHRLVYEIKENVVTVLVLTAYGHYDDR